MQQQTKRSIFPRFLIPCACAYKAAFVQFSLETHPNTSAVRHEYFTLTKPASLIYRNLEHIGNLFTF